VGLFGGQEQRRKKVSYLLSLSIADGSLRDWDEAWYAQISKEIFREGNFLFLRYEDRLWFDKPPLSFWMTALCYRLFGIHEFSARLFSALCGVGTILVLALLGVHLFDRRSGLMAGWFLLTFGHFVQYARRGQTDIPLTFFMTLTFYFFFLGMQRSAFFWPAGLAFGAALLTKGSVAFFSAFIALAYILFTRQWNLFKKIPFWGGLLLAFLLALPWHLYQYYSYPEAFSTHYLGDHLGRFLKAPGANETQVFYFYFQELVENLRPWFLLFYPLLFLSLYELFQRIRSRQAWSRHPGESFALIWIASFLGILSMARTKSSWYILPLYPGIALFFAYGFYQLPLKKQKLAIALFALIFLILPSTSRKILHIDYNPEIKALAPSVQKEVPDSEKLLIYDDPTRDKHSSIFPPSTLFYTDRFLERLPYERTILIQTLQQKPYRPCLLTQFALQELKDLPLETVAQQGHLRLVRWKKEIPHD
jgi:4-amino-4-deoxy-L-arabinose transferase-like glycosyltransferase